MPIVLNQVYVDFVTSILKEIAKKLGLLVISRESLHLTPSQCIVVRDYVGTSTNGISRLKQALEALIPEIKGELIPPSIHRKIALVEGQGVIPACVVEVNVLLTKKGHKRGMRPYTYVQNPMQLFCNMMVRVLLDAKYEPSQMFSNLRDKVVTVIGIDKSDSDLALTIRICNREQGNSRSHVQALAVLEGPVVEEYSNEMLTICNPCYPTIEVLQRLVDDGYFCLYLTGKSHGIPFAAAAVFDPCPTLTVLEDRSLKVFLRPRARCESKVTFDDDRHAACMDSLENDDGLPVRVKLGREIKAISILLVHDRQIESKIVGYQMIARMKVIATNRFYYPLDIGACKLCDIDVRCEQINGHVGNDGKCINILNGQKGCQVLCPMPCCMVGRYDLGKATLWIRMILIVKEKILSMEWVNQLRGDEDSLGVSKYSFYAGTILPSRVLVVISRFDDSILEPDPPRQVGKYSVINTYDDWMHRTGGGSVCMSAAEFRKNNEETGSIMRKPGLVVHSQKQNMGIMHGIAGHTTHMDDLIGSDMQAKRSNCRWITRMKRFKEEINAYRDRLGANMNTGDVRKEDKYKNSLKDIRSNITRTEKKLNDYESCPQLSDLQVERMEAAQDRLSELREEEANIREQRREHALTADTGPVNLINIATDQLEEKVEEGMRKDSKLPREELEFCRIKLLERARGKFDMKRAGTEMTNGNGINMLENYSVVTDGLMKVFPEGTEIYEWLAEKTPIWQRLGEALLAVHLFLKGQGKKMISSVMFCCTICG